MKTMTSLRKMATALLLSLAPGLIAAGPAPARDWRAPLHDSFEAGEFLPSGGLYYKKNYEQSAGSYDFVRNDAYEGNGALKLSVAELCPPGRADCSERAEIWEKAALRVPFDKGIWYGFAVRFGAPVPQDPHRYLIAQWKREIDPGAEGDFSPFLAFRLYRGHLFITAETDFQPGTPAKMVDGVPRCPAGESPVWLRPETNQMRVLVATDAGWTPQQDGAEFASCTAAVQVSRHATLPAPSTKAWVDYTVYSQPDAKGNGRIEIFANGRRIASVRGHIGSGSPDLGGNQYFKFGPYRAAAPGNWTMYYDDFRRSLRCSDVLREEKICTTALARD